MHEDHHQMRLGSRTRNPKSTITGGYDIHVVFESHQLLLATQMFHHFSGFVSDSGFPHLRARIFEEPVGPWLTPMWQLVLPQSDRMHEDLGRCISWLMLNRGPFSVMIHPNTQPQDGRGGSVEDHSENVLWLGAPLELNLAHLR